jgi:hypothetical protein
MARQLETLSWVTGTTGFPVKQGTWDFLQDAYNEQIEAILQGDIGYGYAADTAYLLFGCLTSVSGIYTYITGGAIFYNGEVFLSPSQKVITPTGSDVIVAYVLTSQYTTNADPVTASDNSTHNCHNIRTVAFTTGASGGSGTPFYIADFSSFTAPGAWTNNTLVINSAAAGSIGGYTMQYNRFKVIGKTLFWEFHLTGATIAMMSGSTPFLLYSPTELGILLRYINCNGSSMISCGYYNNGSSIVPIFGTPLAPFSDMYLSLLPASGAWSDGSGQSIIFQIIAEIK